MDFDDGDGSLSVSRFELRSLLSKPIRPIENLAILPVIEYAGTGLDFDGISPAFPIHDEDLHSVSLSAIAVYSQPSSPWLYGAYGRAQISSDFQDISSDDFTYDLAGGVGYRLNNHFTLMAGAAVINLNGDTSIYPGIAFNWTVNDQFRLGLYGPLFIATYTPDPAWEFSLRAENGGDVFNITDDAGKSRSIDLTSYRIGLFAERLITGNLWVRAGGGATFGNEIRLTEPDGDRLFKQEMESGLFAQIGLALRVW